MRSVLAPLLLLSLAAQPAYARTWHVEIDGSGDATSVQVGIGVASTGDTVLVGPGTYFEDIDFLGKDVVLRSLLGPEATILDGTDQDSSVVMFISGETQACILDGFTITNGNGTRLSGTLREGGGVFCPHGSPIIRNNRFIDNHAYMGGAMLVGVQTQPWAYPAPTIESNTFLSNTAVNGGGGLMCFRSTPILRGNVFQENEVLQAGDGGGIHLRLQHGSNAVVEDNQFIENTAYDQGGGIYVYTDDNSGPVTIQRNFIYRNVARGGSPDVARSGAGGGIATDTFRGIIIQNTIVENVALPEGLDTGGGVRIRYPSPDMVLSKNIIARNTNGGLICRWDGNATVGPNIFWQNGEFDLDPSGCPSAWGEVAIIADPYFCSPATGNFQVAANSPALGGTEYFGAFPEPGCGPVPVERTTWGRIKSMYGSNR